MTLHINGVWETSSNTFDDYNPSTGERLAKISHASASDIEKAISAARAAFTTWRCTDVAERASILQRAADLLAREYGDQGQPTELKQLIVNEVGKRLPEADIEVIESSDMLSYFAKNGPRLLAPQKLDLNQELWPTKRSYVAFEPRGVIGIIKPWNYPLELPIWSIGAALIGGNTIVFKPSEYSSLVGVEIVKLFAEAGLPHGVLNLITGDSETGRQLVANSYVDMISFTGSAQAGQEIAQQCGKRLRKCSLELGGNDAALIESDADLELASNGIVWGAFCNSGQVCVRVKRAYVASSIAAEFTSQVVNKVNALRSSIDYGPIISEAQLDAVESFVNDAVEKGAKLLTGGRRMPMLGGYYFSPTVLIDVPADARLLHEECFGPVLPIIAVADTDEAVRLANDSNYGLGASIWTSNSEQGEQIARSLNVGMVWINDVNVAFPEAPWGGTKQSGSGVELSPWGVQEYVQLKHVNLEMARDTRREWWYPY